MDPISHTGTDLVGRTLLSQSWRDVVFLHWRLDPAEIAPLLPDGIVPDIFDGDSWIGLIPFDMKHTSILGSPAVPFFGSFTEVNVRAYGVDAGGRRGVVFLSLEASRLAAVMVARAAFSLPYFWASARSERRDARLTYSTTRLAADRPGARISVSPGSIPIETDPLSDFLTARWRLFVTRGGKTVTLPNAHEPWPLFRAELQDLEDELVATAGIHSTSGRAPDSVLYSPGVRTRFGAPEPASATFTPST